jgi:PAS domain S-box-containing protein
MERLNIESKIANSVVLRYSFAIASVVTAVALALLFRRFDIRNLELPLLLFAVSIAAWYTRSGPAVLSIILSIVLFDFFFTEPRYSFYIQSSDVPYFIVFSCLALLVTWFSTIRRRVEREIVEARDRFQKEAAERSRQASLLDLSHDSIFVRDMRHIITYWNQGAQELYGYTAEQAVGKEPHELLRTIFPAPLEEIRAKLLRTGRWEGELTHTTADGTEVVVMSRWALRRDEHGGPEAIMERITTSHSGNGGRSKSNASTRNLHGGPRNSKALTRN